MLIEIERTSEYNSYSEFCRSMNVKPMKNKFDVGDHMMICKHLERIPGNWVCLDSMKEELGYDPEYIVMRLEDL